MAVCHRPSLNGHDVMRLRRKLSTGNGRSGIGLSLGKGLHRRGRCRYPAVGRGRFWVLFRRDAV